MKLHAALICFTVISGLSACSSKRAEACQSPRGHWQKAVNISGLDFPQMLVAINHESKIFVDGQPTSMDGLRRQLTSFEANAPVVYRVFLETEMGADCDTVESVRDAFDEVLDCKQAFNCNEGIHSLWRRWPVPSGTPPS
jgi:biopolymer transport protein ExbD